METIMDRAGATTMRGNPLTLVGPELKAGEPAPEFSVVDSSLKPVHLKDTSGKTRIFSVVPSLDTPVCDAQTKRFNEEAGKLKDVDFYTVSMDLPFAQKRFCNSFALDNVKMLSDHKDASFGSSYGTLIKELRILSRAIFVVGPDDRLKYVEYVPEVADHPNYDAALTALGDAALHHT
jgi:thiol peroxidase